MEGKAITKYQLVVADSDCTAYPGCQLSNLFVGKLFDTKKQLIEHLKKIYSEKRGLGLWADIIIHDEKFNSIDEYRELLDEHYTDNEYSSYKMKVLVHKIKI